MKHLVKETSQSSHYTPTKPQKVAPGPLLKGKEGIVELKPEQFIRLATKAETISQAAKNKAFNSFSKIEGMQVVYKPYGAEGKGFYYVPETGRIGFELISPELQPPEHQKGLNIVKTELAKANQGRQLSDSEIFAQEYIINNYLIARENFINESKKEFGVDNIISADIGKFAIPGMEAVKSVDYHEAGSALSKARTQELLADPSTKDLPVLFMAGGSGAGKSRSLRAIGVNLDSFAMVHDSNLDNFDNALKKIEDVFASGRKVRITYVYRDPIIAYEQGVIPRIKKQNRIVPIKQHIKTHLGARTNIERLIGKYGDKIKFTIIDNTGRKGEAKESSIDKIPKIRYTLNEIEDKLYEVSKNALQQYEITIEAFKTILEGTSRLQTQWESEWLGSGSRKNAYGMPEASPRNRSNPRRLEANPPIIKHLSSPTKLIPIYTDEGRIEVSPEIYDEIMEDRWVKASYANVMSRKGAGFFARTKERIAYEKEVGKKYREIIGREAKTKEKYASFKHLD